jgi:hypothetical protein
MNLPACHIFCDNINVEPDSRSPALPDIRPDIWYPAFRLAGYPAGRPDIRPNQYPVHPYILFSLFHCNLFFKIVERSRDTKRDPNSN